jgi:hypothetical protein
MRGECCRGWDERSREAGSAPGGDRCEYCRLPQLAVELAFHLEHITARQHGGATELDNLALACRWCNLKKGPNLAGVDPKNGAIVRLFHPRLDSWMEHFRFRLVRGAEGRIELEGLSAEGRATVGVLGFNEGLRAKIRYELWLAGEFGELGNLL